MTAVLGRRAIDALLCWRRYYEVVEEVVLLRLAWARTRNFRSEGASVSICYVVHGDGWSMLPRFPTVVGTLRHPWNVEGKPGTRTQRRK